MSCVRRQLAGSSPHLADVLTPWRQLLAMVMVTHQTRDQGTSCASWKVSKTSRWNHLSGVWAVYCGTVVLWCTVCLLSAYRRSEIFWSLCFLFFTFPSSLTRHISDNKIYQTGAKLTTLNGNNKLCRNNSRIF